MKNKKVIIGACLCLCIALVAVVLIIISDNDNKESEKLSKGTVEQAKKSFQSDIQELKDGRYDKLIYHDFKASIDEVEGVYNIEIQRDTSYKDRTFLENFQMMKEVIDKFFGEDFDKSFISVDFNTSDGESIDVNYYDIETKYTDEEYSALEPSFLFGSDTANGGYMVQMTQSLNHTWLTKYQLGDIHASVYRKVYRYIAGIRQVEDAQINLKDGQINLSEMEERVLDYLANDFPLPISENIVYGIGDARIVDNGDYDGVCFKIRRIYKGIPFEYGSTGSVGGYIDPLGHESGELIYAVSTSPDTLLGFGTVNGTVVENETISEMFTLGAALNMLSEKIGTNSTYDVYGVELVYRECEVPEEQTYEIEGILTPRWKVTTVNQNDDKYTVFYIDVVTGEITERFEYYYE